MNAENIAEYISDKMAERNELASQFARRAGIEQTTISRILNNKVRTVSDEICQKIAKAEGIDFTDLFLIARGQSIGQVGEASENYEPFKIKRARELAEWLVHNADERDSEFIYRAAESAGFQCSRTPE